MWARFQPVQSRLTSARRDCVDDLALAKRRKAPQGRKPKYTDRFIIALTVYQKLSGFRYAQQMLAVLGSLGVAVPSPATFCERKSGTYGTACLGGEAALLRGQGD